MDGYQDQRPAALQEARNYEKGRTRIGIGAHKANKHSTEARLRPVDAGLHGAG